MTPDPGAGRGFTPSMDSFDFIIVGAGSAGCVLADKLSQNGRYSVAVIEAGGSDRRFWIKLPIGYGRTFYDDRINWKFETEPIESCNGRRGYWPRGKVLGGSSSINALVYFRGLPQDFDDWSEADARGWGWRDVKPVFEGMERRINADGTERGKGMVCVSDVADRVHPVNRNFLAGAREAGLTVTDDLNGDHPEGVGAYQITTRKGLRWSAADAFLRPALKRSNVTLISDAHVERLQFEGRRVTGVTYRHKGGITTLSTRREVILSAGAVGSPQILQVSGIGSGAPLQNLGIDVVFENGNVGANLQDHVAVTYFFKATEPTLNNKLAPWWGKMLAGMEYVFTQRGPLSLSVNQCGGFVRSSPGAEQIDMQLYFNPVTYMMAPQGKRRIVNPDPFPGFQVSAQPTRPTSRGRIEIASPDPRSAPQIHPNYLATTKDLDDVVAGGKLVQRLMKTPSLQRLTAEPIPPDPAVLDDQGLIDDFRERATTVYHPTSTCRMSSDETEGVVGPDLKVHGVDGLRVVDASVFPNITSGNTNAPVIMVAHKAAEIILSDSK